VEQRTPSADNPITAAHVLVVDDEPVTAQSIANTLRGLGHRPTICHTWTDAVRIFGTGDVDLVLMDAVMPTVDGFKLTRMLRKRGTTYVPIVFLTGLADHGAREQGVAVGADDFLTKPVDPLELKVRLTAMLRIRALTRDLEAKTRALTRLASVDGLTGVANRRSFDERLPAELERARNIGSPLTLLMLDIDHFKRVNDTFGHAVGDQLLASFGRLLGELTRACDLPFRYGGEEFSIVAIDTSPAQATHLAQRVRSAFSLRTRQATECGPQTISVGVCGSDQIDASAPMSELIIAADAALYRAKRSGRNCVCVYDPAEDSRGKDNRDKDSRDKDSREDIVHLAEHRAKSA
jgi:diguanylate cyclase (GGDEF)-like protein